MFIINVACFEIKRAIITVFIINGGTCLPKSLGQVGDSQVKNIININEDHMKEVSLGMEA